MKASKRFLAACLCMILASLPILTSISAEDGPPTSIPPPPGPITLSFDNIEQTLYLLGNNKQYLYWPIEVTSDVSAYGSVSWELTREAGDAVTMYLTDQTETSCSLRYRDITSVGSVSYSLTCRVGHYAKTAPINVEVSGATVPDTMLAFQQVYTAAAGDAIAIPRPDLLPLSTDVPAESFDFGLIIPRWAEGGVTYSDTSSEMNVCQFEVPGYYQGSIWMHNFSNIAFRHNLLFVITDAAGAVPGSPLHLLPAAMEETVYLGGTAEGFRLGRCELQDARYAPGIPAWSVTPEAGDALMVEINNGTEESCEVVLAGMAHEGDAAFSLHCAIGEYSASIPALFHVSAASVPTSMSVSANVYRAATGETISVSRPELLPAGTGLPADDFDFMVALDPSVLSASLVSKGFDAIGLRFDEPGYYHGRIVMREGNIIFSDYVLFIISDAGGAVPGSPIPLDKSIVEATVYLGGSVENAVIAQVRMQSTLDADLWDLPTAYFGEPVWSLYDMSGDAMRLRAEAGPPDVCSLVAASLSHTGDVAGTLWCDSGGFNGSVPVLIHVVDAVLPERMETADLYSAMVGEEINIPCPNLLPEGTQPTENYFTPGLSGDAAFESAATWQPTKEGGIDLSFSAPGMYVASLSMSHSNIRIARDVRFDILPAPVLTLDSITLSARGIPLGGSVIATALASGAAGDTLYAFRAYKDGSATGIRQSFGPDNSFNFETYDPGLYTIQAAAWDGRNLASAFSPSIAVDYAMRVELHFNAERFAIGDRVQATASASRGSGEYNYAFQVIKDGVILDEPGMSQDFSPSSSFSFVPAASGLYAIRVIADDGITSISRGGSFRVDPPVLPLDTFAPLRAVTSAPTRTPRPAHVTPRISLPPEVFTLPPVTPLPIIPEPITPEPEGFSPITMAPITVAPITIAPFITPLAILWPLAVNAQANLSYTETGQPISVKALASGGTGSYEYSFLVYREDTALGSATPFSAKNTFSFTPTKAGNYKVLVNARDGKSKAFMYTGNINVK